MAELNKVNAPVRKPLFEGVQGENEARSIQFDITPWVEELGDGVVTATAKRSQDSQPYPVTVTKDGNVVTWKPTSTDTAFAGVGSFQLEYTVDDVLAKTCIWSTMVAPSLDPAGDPPDPYDNYLAEMREIAADAIQAAQDADESADDAQAEVYEAEAWAKGTKNGTPVSSSDAQYQNNSKYFAEESYKNAEAWAVGQRGGVDVPSTDPTYENNAKYWAEQSLANQYGAYIVKSASGEIASFSDGADDVPMKSLKVAIVPKQSGSGDPSPSNVRPITGWTDADVTVSSKNIAVNNKGDATINGVTFSVQADGSVKVSGTATASIFYTYNSEYKTVTEIGLKAGEQYRVSGGKSDNLRFGMQCRYGSNVLDAGSGASFTASETEQYNIAIYVQNGVTVNDTIYPMVRPASTDATYEPAKPITTTPVPLGQTVYGGEVDVTTGVLTLNRMYYAFTGNESISLDQHYGVNRFDATVLPYVATGLSSEIYCSHFLPSTTITSSNPRLDNVINAYNKRLLWRDDACATVADMKAYFTQQANNGTPVQAVVPMAPITAQLTPTQVATLLGTNNVWSDAGSVEVEYRADPTLAYNELANVIISLGGNL